MIKTPITYNQTHSLGRKVFAGSPNHWTTLYPKCAILCTHTTYIWGLPRYILVYFKGQVNIYVRGCDVAVGCSRLLIGLWILIPWCNLRGGGMVTHYRQLIYLKKKNIRHSDITWASRCLKSPAAWFLAATKQLYDWFSPFVRPSVCPSVTPFSPCSLIVSSWNFQELLPWSKVMSMQKVNVRGQRSRSQRSTPNLAVSVL